MLPNRPRASLLAVLAALTLPLEAAEWALEPEISARTRYDDNFRLNRQNELSVWETALLPKLTFSRNTELTRLAGIAGFNLRRFDEDGLDTNDRFLRFRSSRATERSRWGLDADYARDSSLDSELVDGQEFLDRVPRDRWSLSPNWFHSLNETTSLNASYQLVDLSYPDSPNDQQYIGYQYHTGNLGIGYQLKPLTRLVTQVSLSRSERDDESLRSSSRQLTLGVEHQFSERLSGTAFVGYGRTESEFQQGFLSCSGVVLPGFFFGTTGSVCVDPNTLNLIAFTPATTAVTSKSSNTVFNGDLRYRFETGDVAIQASRSITPYTDGGLILNERIGLSGRHRLTSQLQASLSLDWYRTGNTSDFSSTIDRTTTSIRPSLRWKFDQDWSLAASYRYFRQEYEGNTQPASSNAVDLTLTYNWPRMAVSR